MYNLWRTVVAIFKFMLFWIAVFVQIPIVILIPKGPLSVAYSRIFYKVLMDIVGVKIKVIGKLSDKRPLLLVSNHVSIFELATFPVAFGASFFSKTEVAKYPLIGWFAKKFGVIFISRDRAGALDAVEKINKAMEHVPYPMTLFPEGITTTGTYIAPFKSSMFNVVENNPKLTIQPVVMIYRDRKGNKIPDEVMSAEYADYALARQMPGELIMRKKDGVAFGTAFHLMKLGGCVVEFYLLPPPPLADMNRKEIAARLHEIISDEFYKLK